MDCPNSKCHELSSEYLEMPAPVQKNQAMCLQVPDTTSFPLLQEKPGCLILMSFAPGFWGTVGRKMGPANIYTHIEPAQSG